MSELRRLRGGTGGDDDNRGEADDVDFRDPIANRKAGEWVSVTKEDEAAM